MTQPRILVVDDKANLRRLFERILGDRYAVTTAADGAAAQALLSTSTFDLLLTDVRMPGLTGVDLLRWVKQHSPATEVVIMTAFGSVPAAVEAIREGAYDYVTKPFDPDDIALVLARALDDHRRRAQHPVAAPDAAELTQLSYREAVERGRERSAREYLAALLREFNGNVTHAAARAGIERESLHRLLRRYGLQSDDFKSD